MNDLGIAFVSRMRDIPRTEWDGLADRYGCPFLSWGYLALLEESGSIGPQTGWTPAHLTLRRSGRLVAAAPLYVRTDSWGDYVFDFEFAAYADTIKAPYYPKLVGTVPATPAPVWRIMVDPSEDESDIGALCVDAAVDAARRAGLAGVHMLWLDRDFLAGLPRAAHGWQEWNHQYFEWHNENYRDLDDCLGAFSKNMRRNVGRERESVRAAGIGTRTIPARLCPPRLLDLMADYYEDTNSRFGPYAAKFLTRDFFTRLPEFMPTGWLLSAAFNSGEGDPVALAFLLEGRDELYGRFWGSASKVPGLHFEVCYYTPMDYAAKKGLRAFDPGMGSEHKARRGFRAHLCSSLHLVFDRRMARVFEASMPGINEAERETVESLNRDLPFKKRPSGLSGSSGVPS